MKLFRTIAFTLAFTTAAGTAGYTAVKYLRDFSAPVSLSDNDNTFWCQVVGGCTATDPLKRVTLSQLWAYIFGKVSGDFIINPATGVGTLSNSGVSASTYGNSTNVPQVTVDAKGRVTNATNVAISGSAGGTVTTVKDPSTTVSSPAIVNFTTGCTVSNNAGNADVSCPGGGGGSGTVNSGTGNQLAWYATSGTTVGGNSNVLVAGGALQVNFNSNALPAPPAGGAQIELAASDGNTTRIIGDTFGNTTGTTFTGRLAAGTNASKSAVQSGSRLVGLSGWGYGATGYSSADRGHLIISAAENWSDTAQGTRLSISTTAKTTTSTTERVSIEDDGGLLVNTSGGAAPTGGSKGPGTINLAGGVYINNVPVGAGSVVGSGVEAGSNATVVTTTGTMANNVLVEQIGALAASITRTLPAISGIGSNPSPRCFSDAAVNVTGSHTLIVAPNGADAINGASLGVPLQPLTGLTSICFRVAATHMWQQEGGGAVPTSSSPDVTHPFADGLGVNGLTFNTTLSTALDNTLGTTQGMIPLRGASLWGGAALPANHALVASTGTALAALAPSTSGNVATSNGTDWTSAALPVGSSSVKGVVQVDNSTITATAGVISAVGGGGAMTLVGTTCTYNGTGCQWTGLTGSEYQIRCHALIGNGSDAIGIQIGTGGTPTWSNGSSDYVASSLFATTSTPTAEISGNHQAMFAVVPASSGEGIMIDANIHDLNSTSAYKTATATFGKLPQPATGISVANTVGTTAGTAIRMFNYSGGTGTSGKCSLYAIAS